MRFEPLRLVRLKLFLLDYSSLFFCRGHYIEVANDLTLRVYLTTIQLYNLRIWCTGIAGHPGIPVKKTGINPENGTVHHVSITYLR